MQEMWETWVWSLGQEDSLDEGMATHSSILAWRIPWAEESGGLQSIGRKMLDTTKHSRAHSNLSWNSHMGREGNGTPLQYSCLENPMISEAW